MDAVLHISTGTYETIKAHLLQNRLEQVVFAFATVVRSTEALTFDTQAYRLVPPEGFSYQTEYGVELTDTERANVIKMAWDNGSSLVELHSHPRARIARFSASDLAGFKEFVPHLWWRLKARPYLAIVVGPRNFDGLFWSDNPERPGSIRGMLVGSRLLRPTGRTWKDMSRQ